MIQHDEPHVAEPNPWQTPGATVVPTPSTGSVPKRIFSPSGVGTAAFIGGPLAGGMALFLNESRLGRTPSGIAYMAGSALLTAALVGLGMVADIGSLGTAISTALTFAYYSWAKKSYEENVLELESHGAKPLGPGWGLLTGLPVLITLVLVTLFSLGIIGGKSESYGDVIVSVEEGASREEAALAAQAWYFAGATSATAYVGRDRDTWVFGSVMLDDWHDSRNASAEGSYIANYMSAVVFDGEPTRFEATDDLMAVEATYESDGRFGGGRLFGTGSVVFIDPDVERALLDEVVSDLGQSNYGESAGYVLRLFENADGYALCACTYAGAYHNDAARSDVRRLAHSTTLDPQPMLCADDCSNPRRIR